MRKYETVLRHRAALTTDSHGNVVESWTAPAELPIAGCLFAPTSAENLDGNRDGQHAQADLYVPATADVAARDRILRGGLTYTVDGQPADWPAGKVAALQRWDG